MHLMQTYILDSRNMNLQLQQNLLHSSTGETLCFSMKIQSKSQQEKIIDLCKSVLPHPSYSRNLSPKDLHPFNSLQNIRNDK